MRRIFSGRFLKFAAPILSIFISTTLYAARGDVRLPEEPEKPKVRGGVELNFFLDTVVGFQRFSRDPITEIADDGSYAGVMGENLSLWPAANPIVPGQDVLSISVPKIEIDIAKHFGERARLRGDISFGRPNSGSYINSIVASHAYAAISLTKDNSVEVLIGRFGLQAGYEPFRGYHNDTVSWSIMWRGALYPPGATGIQLSADLTNTFTLYLTAANGAIRDSTAKGNTMPAFIASLEWDWGSDARPNLVVLTPYISSDSGGNRPFSYGGDATFIYWFDEHLKLGLEGCYLMTNDNGGGENTAYASGLFNLKYQFNPKWYGVLKYVFARQFGSGNGALNLTGAKQNIHESSIGFGYQLTDIARIKGEFRMDVINPTYSPTQTIPGAAIEYAWFF